jgi:hypothetical protein
MMIKDASYAVEYRHVWLEMIIMIKMMVPTLEGNGIYMSDYQLGVQEASALIN